MSPTFNGLSPASGLSTVDPGEVDPELVITFPSTFEGMLDIILTKISLQSMTSRIDHSLLQCTALASVISQYQ